jgi:predicted glutamine amidotransferase
MSQFWGITLNQDNRLECALAPHTKQINMRTADAGAWGLAYYHRGELLQRVEPKKSGEPLDIADVTRSINCDVIAMHTRAAGAGLLEPENTHPFRFKDWIFAHNGTFEGFSKFREKLLDSMPPYIKRGISGETDSEHVFHLFLSFLYDGGLLNRPDPGVEAICGAVRRSFATVDEFAKTVGVEERSPASVLVSDGYSFVVVSRGIPVDFATINGISDCEICRPSIRPGEKDPLVVDHPNLRGVIARSGPRAIEGDLFERLPNDSCLLVSRKHETSITNLN